MSMGAFKWAPNMMVKMLFYHWAKAHTLNDLIHSVVRPTHTLCFILLHFIQSPSKSQSQANQLSDQTTTQWNTHTQSSRITSAHFLYIYIHSTIERFSFSSNNNNIRQTHLVFLYGPFLCIRIMVIVCLTNVNGWPFQPDSNSTKMNSPNVFCINTFRKSSNVLDIPSKLQYQYPICQQQGDDRLLKREEKAKDHQTNTQNLIQEHVRRMFFLCVPNSALTQDDESNETNEWNSYAVLSLN